jgi:hypothetical protein
VGEISVVLLCSLNPVFFKTGTMCCNLNFLRMDSKLALAYVVDRLFYMTFYMLIMLILAKF